LRPCGGGSAQGRLRRAPLGGGGDVNSPRGLVQGISRRKAVQRIPRGFPQRPVHSPFCCALFSARGIGGRADSPGFPPGAGPQPKCALPSFCFADQTSQKLGLLYMYPFLALKLLLPDTATKCCAQNFVLRRRVKKKNSKKFGNFRKVRFTFANVLTQRRSVASQNLYCVHE
jgi:hypothetical protein